MKVDAIGILWLSAGGLVAAFAYCAVRLVMHRRQYRHLVSETFYRDAGVPASVVPGTEIYLHLTQHPPAGPSALAALGTHEGLGGVPQKDAAEDVLAGRRDADEAGFRPSRLLLPRSLAPWPALPRLQRPGCRRNPDHSQLHRHGRRRGPVLHQQQRRGNYRGNERPAVEGAASDAGPRADPFRRQDLP